VCGVSSLFSIPQTINYIVFGYPGDEVNKNNKKPFFILHFSSQSLLLFAQQRNKDNKNSLKRNPQSGIQLPNTVNLNKGFNLNDNFIFQKISQS